MRRQGRIVEWNETRGFGFIQLNGSKDRAYAHVTDFTHRAGPPLIGDAVTYGLTDDQGRPKAIMISFVGAAALARQIPPPRRGVPDAGSWGIGSKIAVAAVLIATATVWYYHSQGDRWLLQSPSQASVPAITPAVEKRQVFQCTGKRHCSQMASCDEARFYNRYCPDTLMDGDSDGLPCEDLCY